MSDPHERDLIEIYKLHAELADRVSQRREGANRLYVTLLVGLVVFVAALLRFGAGDRSIQMIMWPVGALGALLSASWYIVIRSCRQLNDGKFLALHELEKQLPYAFFTREWELLGEGRDVEPLLEAHDRRGGSPVDFLPLVVLRHGGGAAPLSGPLGGRPRRAHADDLVRSGAPK